MINNFICFRESSFISVFVFHRLPILGLFQDFAENEKDSPKNTTTNKVLSKIKIQICFLDFVNSIFKFSFKY